MSPPRPSSPRLAGPVVLPTASIPLRSPSADSSFGVIEKNLSALPEYYAREDLLTKLLQGYFSDVRLKASLRFGQSTLVVEDSPDLHIREGAGICAEARIQEGRLSFPQPLRLGGFYAAGGLYDFCSVDSDSDGKIRLKSCDCSLPKDSDITEPALKGPLAQIFPDKKIRPLPLADLLKALSNPPPDATPSGEDPFLSALRSIELKAEIPSGPWIDDPPGTPGGACRPLMASLEAYLDVPSLKKNLAEGLWRSFDFSGLERGSKLLWPRFDLTRLPLPEGWKISEGAADVEIRHFPEAGTTEIKVSALDARAKIPGLFGESELSIAGGAKIQLRRGGEYEVSLQDLRVIAPLHSIEASALPNISVILNGTIQASQLKLSLSDLELHIPSEKSARLGASGLSWNGTLVGQGAIEYDPAGKQLKKVELGLSGDLSVLNGEGSSLLKAEGLSFSLKGDATGIELEGDALALNYGAASVHPQFHFEVKPRREGDQWALAATGNTSFKGINIPLTLASALKVDFDSERGQVDLSSIEFRYGAQEWTRKGSSKIRWSEKGLFGNLSLPDLPGGNSLDLSLRRLADSENLSGSFKLRPSKISLSPGLFAEDLRLSGSFSTGPWSMLLAKPRMNLNAKLQGKLGGSIQGPFGAELKGSLSYAPARRSIYLWLNPKRDSRVHMGPLSISGEERPIEADLPLKGTWQAVLLPRGVLVGGRGVGIEGGEVRIGKAGSQIKMIEGFTLLADQLWSVQNGIAYAGGDGIRLEGRVDPSAWLGSTVQGLGSRKIFLVTDQLPLSLDAYWQLFAKSLKTEEGKN